MLSKESKQRTEESPSFISELTKSNEFIEKLDKVKLKEYLDFLLRAGRRSFSAFPEKIFKPSDENFKFAWKNILLNCLKELSDSQKISV